MAFRGSAAIVESRHFFFALFFCAVFFGSAAARCAHLVHPAADTASQIIPRRDSLPRDSIPRDSTPRRVYKTLRQLGAINGDTLTSQRIKIERDANETFDLVSQDAHAYPLLLGPPGQDNELLLDGLDTRNIAVMIAGRPVNNPISGRYSFLDIAPEFSEITEIVHGPRAAILGFNATDAAINFVPQFLNINRPFVRVRYYQSSFEHLASDIAFSQNVSRSVNVSFGIDRESQIGEFTNQGLQYWNLNGSVRWFADTTFNLLLSENFTHNHDKLNGGLVPQDINVNNQLANVFLPVADADEVRHDLTLTALLRDPHDSLFTTNISLYYSSQHREYYARPDLNGNLPAFPFAEIAQANTAHWYGMEARQTAGFGQLHFTGGASLELPATDSSVNLPASSQLFAGAYGMLEQHFGDALALAAFGRADVIAKTFRPTLGADATFNIGNGFSFTAGLARTERVPTLQEQSWNAPTFVGLNFAPQLPGVPAVQNEIHSIITAGLRIRTEPLTISIDAGWREIQHPVEAVLTLSNAGDSLYALEQGAMRHVWTLSTSMELRVGHFMLSGSGIATIEEENGMQLRNLPVLSARGGIYFYHPHFLGVPLELRAGIEGTAFTSFVGETYLPGEQFFVPTTNGFLSIPDGQLDWIIMAHIGDAYIRIGVKNILDRRAYYTPFYPIDGQTFHVGFTWSLFD